MTHDDLDRYNDLIELRYRQLKSQLDRQLIMRQITYDKYLVESKHLLSQANTMKLDAIQRFVDGFGIINKNKTLRGCKS